MTYLWPSTVQIASPQLSGFCLAIGGMYEATFPLVLAFAAQNKVSMCFVNFSNSGITNWFLECSRHFVLLSFYNFCQLNHVIKKIIKQGDHDDAREITAVWCSNVKKLNFVEAILDFWRAFLNQFWPNLVHTYKIHFWISFVLA